MRAHWIAPLLAAALTLASLSACGGAPAETSPVPTAAPSAPVRETQSPETQAPEPAAPAETEAPAEPSPSGAVSPVLSHADVTLDRAGQTFTLRLKTEGASEDVRPALVWSSSDETVAAVTDNRDGTATVTAIGPGTATVTADGVYSTYAPNEPLALSCIVRCRWAADDGAAAPETNAPAETAPPAESQAPAAVDLAAFAQKVLEDYSFGALSLADQELMDGFYPGLSALETEQCLVYVCMMSLNNGEFALVQVRDSGDASAAADILQARVDGMIDGGAWYPEATERWTNDSRVVSSGNYVMMVVHESADAIVDSFRALTR